MPARGSVETDQDGTMSRRKEKLVKAQMLGASLRERLGEYFDAGVAEGREGRNHDTLDGTAQGALQAVIDQVNVMLQAERDDCADLLVMSESELRLLGGEFSEQEMRAVQAVLANRRKAMLDDALR
jgi:hypothetical protein